MATVFVPSGMRELTGGVAELQIEGATVRQIIRKLEEAHPGTQDWLVEDDRLKPNISVAIDGVVSPLGLLADVGPASEVHFVAAISGGCDALQLTSPTGSVRLRAARNSWRSSRDTLPSVPAQPKLCSAGTRRS